MEDHGVLSSGDLDEVHLECRTAYRLTPRGPSPAHAVRRPQARGPGPATRRTPAPAACTLSCCNTVAQRHPAGIRASAAGIRLRSGINRPSTWAVLSGSGAPTWPTVGAGGPAVAAAVRWGGSSTTRPALNMVRV